MTTFDDILEDFRFLDDWEDRYGYIIELGGQLEDMPNELRTEEHRVQGCVSNVWLVLNVEAGGEQGAEPPNENQPVIRFQASSDSQIVRGLVAILVVLCNGKSAAEI